MMIIHLLTALCHCSGRYYCANTNISRIIIECAQVNKKRVQYCYKCQGSSERIRMTTMMRTMVKVNTDGVYLVGTLGRPQLPSLLSHNPHQFLSSFKPTMSDCKHIDGPSRKTVEIGEHLRKGTKLTDASSQSNFLTNFHPDIC